MKKTILLAAVAAWMSVNAFAQQEKNAEARWDEKVENRAERIAERMGLDDKTEEKFEADYKKMMQERSKVMASHREAMKCCGDSACRQNFVKGKKGGRKQNCMHLSDADAAKRLQSMLEVRQKNLDIVKDYSKKMGKYLNDKQVLQVMSPMLHQGNACHKTAQKGKKQGNHHGKYQQGQPSRTYDCMVRRPRK